MGLLFVAEIEQVKAKKVKQKLPVCSAGTTEK